jgi:ATP-binding cassette subfamily B (MDR/TAP) protein 1
MVFPAFGVLYAKGINGFSDLDPHQRRHDGDRNALYFFIIALGSTCTIGIQNYLFTSAAGALTAKVRSLSFRAILRQDGELR